MKKSLLITLLLLLVAVVAIPLVMRISYRNQEKSLRYTFEAKTGEAEASHDKMRKVIFQKAQISSEYADKFEKIFPSLIAGRYQNTGNGDGSLMKFVVEANPNFDISLYKDLQQSVEAERAAFLNVQKEVLDVERQYNTFIVTEPGSWFLPDGTKPVKYTVVSSGYTKQVMQTGLDEEVDLFQKPQGK